MAIMVMIPFSLLAVVMISFKAAAVMTYLLLQAAANMTLHLVMALEKIGRIT